MAQPQPHDEARYRPPFDDQLVEGAVQPVTARHQNDYATHMPILIGLGYDFPHIKRVLEFGSGSFSTPLFLNRDVFPNLERLLSIEPDPVWRADVPLDSRAEFLDRPIIHDLTPFDLIFIDWGNEQEKINLIRNYSFIAHYQLVVVHDSEHGPYREALSEFSYWRDFDSYNPSTAVAMNSLPPLSFDHIDRTVRANVDRLEPDDVRGWMASYGRFL